MTSKTLFVRNLPYSTSDSQLEELFSRHGPLKACFTVKEKGLCTIIKNIYKKSMVIHDGTYEFIAGLFNTIEPQAPLIDVEGLDM